MGTSAKEPRSHIPEGISFDELGDDDAGIFMEGTGDVLIITFGGLKHGIGIPAFEFRKFLSGFPVTRGYLRDHAQTWYHDGVRGAGASMADVTSYLKDLMGGYRKTIFAGNSMGGFAALYFGAHAGANKILAFAPQTFIGPARRLRHGDFRWYRQLSETHLRHGLRLHVFDIANLNLENAEIYAGADSRLDCIHAERLSGTGAQITIVPETKHGLVRDLKKSGELVRIFTSAIG
ncbi:MAG: hypothetical protein ACR2OR_08095 [Hyphomicrobiales bacterium]